MASSGVVDMSNAGQAAQPSPSIWKDCPGYQLNDEAQGYFVHEDFLGIGAAADKSGVGQFTIISTGTTVLTQKVGVSLLGGFLNVATGTSDNDSSVLYLAPFASIVLNSGNKVWFETRMEQGALDDRGFFFGMVEQAGQLGTLIADNPSNAAQSGLIGESLVGFVSQQVASAASKVDIVYKLDAGAAVTILADATNAAAITSQGGTVGNLVAATPIKLGFRFDGGTGIDFFVNGRKVINHQINPALFPKGVPMGPALSVKTGTAATKGMALDWARAAHRLSR